MSTPTSSSRSGAPTPRRAAWPDPGMRVSDADRAEVADRLAKHYGDGRLDQAEFEQRLDQAMRAKTRADLIGLLTDLPEDQPQGGPPQSPQARRQQQKMLRMQLERERLMLKHERREHRRYYRTSRWHSMRQLPILVLVVVLAVIGVRVLRDIYGIWLVIAVLAFLWLRQAHRNRGQ